MPKVLILPLELYWLPEKDIYSHFAEALSEARVNEADILWQCLPLPARVEDYFRGPSLPALYEKLCRGDFSLNEWYNHLRVRLPKMDIEAFKQAWAKKRGLSERLKQAFTEIEALIKDRRDIKIYWVGNVSPLDMEIILEQYNKKIPGNTFFSYEPQARALRKELLVKLLAEVRKKHPDLRKEDIAYIYNGIGLAPYHRWGRVAWAFAPRQKLEYRRAEQEVATLKALAEDNFQTVRYYSQTEGPPNIYSKLQELNWEQYSSSPRRRSFDAARPRARSPSPARSESPTDFSPIESSRPTTPTQPEPSSQVVKPTAKKMGIVPSPHLSPAPVVVPSAGGHLGAIAHTPISPSSQSAFKTPQRISGEYSSMSAKSSSERKRRPSLDSSSLAHSSPLPDDHPIENLQLSGGERRDSFDGLQQRGSLGSVDLDAVLSFDLLPAEVERRDSLQPSGSPIPPPQPPMVGILPNTLTAYEMSKMRRGSTVGLPGSVPIPQFTGHPAAELNEQPDSALPCLDSQKTSASPVDLRESFVGSSEQLENVAPQKKTSTQLTDDNKTSPFSLTTKSRT